jgi:hypothetical protein
LSNIEHCRLAVNPRNGEPFKIVGSGGEAKSLRDAGWPVVEYAPADRLQGAVESARVLAAFVRWQRSGREGPQPHTVMEVIGAIEAIDHFGGQ